MSPFRPCTSSMPVAKFSEGLHVNRYHVPVLMFPYRLRLLTCWTVYVCCPPCAVICGEIRRNVRLGWSGPDRNSGGLAVRRRDKSHRKRVIVRPADLLGRATEYGAAIRIELSPVALKAGGDRRSIGNELLAKTKHFRLASSALRGGSLIRPRETEARQKENQSRREWQ